MKKSDIHITDVQPLFGPASLLSAFGNSLSSPLLNSPLSFKGIYRRGKGVSYNGMYYDILKDEYNESNITLVVPEVIRQNLNENQVIEGWAYLTKRLTVTSGRIDLLLNLTEVVSKKERSMKNN